MKYLVIICMILIISLNMVDAHNIHYNSHNANFNSHSYIKSSYGHQESHQRYSEILGTKFKKDNQIKTIHYDNSEYYFRYSRTFDKYQAVKCHSSAPDGKLFYIKC